MGRPLDRRLTGASTNNGNKLTVKFWDGYSITTGWIIEQTGNGEYLVTNGEVTDQVELLSHLPTAQGEGAIEVQVYNGSVEFARNILSHRVKTFEGGNYVWSLDPAVSEGEADLPLA